ncbi:MAG: 6-bladed beta-propeller [Balneolales bacterium]|nr:6-bladed beta-propeller [Balneolales bacterium]
MNNLHKPWYVILILLSGFVTANEESTILQDIPSYSISPLQATQISAQDVVADFKYIPLESPGTSFFLNIRKVIFRDSEIYILDMNPNGSRPKITVYDDSGKFRFAIDRPGRGPGEFEFIYDFVVTDDRIIIVTAARFLFFDRFTGEHMDTQFTNFTAEGIQWVHFFDNETGVFAAGRGRANQSKNHYKFFDLKTSSIIQESVPFSSAALILTSLNNRSFFETSEGLFSRPVNSNIVYKIDRDEDSFVVEPQYMLDFGRLWVPESFLRTSFQNMNEIFNRGLHDEFVVSADIYETSSNLYVNYVYERDRFAYLFDKTSEKSANISEFVENEIGWPFRPVATQDDWIVGVVYPYDLQQNSTNIDPTLQNILNNSDDDGNPILIFAKFELK